MATEEQKPGAKKNQGGGGGLGRNLQGNQIPVRLVINRQTGNTMILGTAPFMTKRRKGDAEKVALARRLRAETTMSLKWIAGELHMGSWTYVSNLLSQKAHKSVNSED